MSGPFFQFDLPGTRRVVDAVRRVESLPNFDAPLGSVQSQGDGVLLPLQVVSIPANNSTYVIAQPYSFNGSNGNAAPFNYSVAVVTPHSVGDLLYAIPVGCSLQHLTDANGAAILLQEISGQSAVSIVELTGITVTAGSASGAALGGGYYALTVLTAPSSPGAIDPTANLTQAAIGTLGTLSGYGQNPYEMGESTHNIDLTGTYLPNLWAALHVGSSTASTGSLPVYMLIAPLQTKLCS